MLRTLVFVIAITCQSELSAQLMIDRYPPPDAGRKIRIATDIPTDLRKGSTLRFDILDINFDGGSYGAFFQSDTGAKLTLFFANPSYWSAKAKLESKQPIAIHSKRIFLEIGVGSVLETRLLELLADDIADGEHNREDLLTLIRIRDCLIHRKPLREIAEQFDLKSGKRRPQQSTNDVDPFDF